MVFECEGKFLSGEVKTSKKGNMYNVITFMQGTDTDSLMSDKLPNLEFGQDVILTLEYNKQFKQLKILDVK